MADRLRDQEADPGGRKEDPWAGEEGDQLKLRYEPLEFVDDPYPLYRRLRDEAPLYRHPTDGFWVLSRYADVQGAARDWRTFSSAQGNDLDDTWRLFAPAGELTHADPPLHTRLRNAVQREFGVSAVKSSLEDLARETTRSILASLIGRSEVDLAAEVSERVPASMICGWLGFPEADHGRLIAWWRAMLERTPMERRLPDAAIEARDEMRDYIEDAMDARRPAAGDLLSVLVAAVDDGRLSTDEAIGAAMLLFFAGITTTSALLSAAFRYLAELVEQRLALQRSPELIPAAVEELLRFDAPIQWLTRVVAQPVALHGTTIPDGDRVLLLWASANRDERRWEDPDELRFTREPKRHIAFGEGIHHCLGAPLARLEARVVLDEFLPLVEDFALAGPVERQLTQSERAIARLPMAVDWSPAAMTISA